VFDVNAIFTAIRVKPGHFGITNTTDACLDTPSCATGDVETQNEFLFFDGVHPTTNVHEKTAKILAEAIRWGQLATSSHVLSRLIDRRR